MRELEDATPNKLASRTAYLARREVLEVTTLSRAALRRLCRSGKFPRPRRLSPGRVAWLARDVALWCRTRPAA